MKIYKILLIIIIFVCISGFNNPKHENSKEKSESSQIDIYRLNFLLRVKQYVAEKYWADFSKKKISGTIHYYTLNSEYLINPSEYLTQKSIVFSRIFIPKKFNSLSSMNILHKKNKDTSVSFNMATTVDYSDTNNIHNNNPIAYCSDINITRSFIKDIADLENWATIVIHEVFHLYQYSIPTFRSQIKSLIRDKKYIPQKKLEKIFKENSWYADSIRKENDLLLLALSETNPPKIKEHIDLFLKTRKQRREKYLQETNFDIAHIERLNEAFEGGARYIEFKTKKYFKEASTDEKLLGIDIFYNSNRAFIDYSLEGDEGLYHVSNEYFYATGFNMIRLLENLNIDFKNELYSKSPLLLEYYLGNV